MSEEKETHPALRKRIREIFELFDKESNEIIVKEEVGTILRYFDAYPTEEELVTVILPKLQDEEEPEFVRKERFEEFMLEVLLERQYEPDSEGTVLEALKTLDPEGKGYVDEKTIVAALQSNEWGFREKEVEDFLRHAKDPDTGYIHFEDYAALLTES